MNIKNKEFVVLGYSSGLAEDAIMSFSKSNQIFGTYFNNKPKEKKNNLKTFKLDLSNELDIKNFIHKIQKNLKNIIVINFAAFKVDNLLVNQDLKLWENTFKVNITSNFLIAKYLLPIMIDSKWGRFIHISSEKAIRGSAGSTAYSASKSALHGYSKSLAKEYARFGITSNILNLGYFDSGLFNRLDKNLQNSFLDSIPSKKLGSAKDINYAINFIINSGYTNGSVINIDGSMN